jgi:hypothetical protein
MSFPDGVAEVVCSSEDPSIGSMTEDARGAGLIRCKYEDKTSFEANLNVAGVGVYTWYDFFPARDGEEPQLFKIVIRSNIEYLDRFIEAFTTKYGKPISISRGTTQNQLGGTFPTINLRWDRGDSSIFLDTRQVRADHLVG